MNSPGLDEIDVLFVCTGNVCRSPFAEYSLRTLIDAAGVGDFHIESRGIYALAGRPAEEDTQAVAAENHISGIAEHRAKQIYEEDVRRSRLIVPLARNHRKEIVTRYPAAIKKTFMLREILLLATYLDYSTAGGGRNAEFRALNKQLARSRAKAVALPEEQSKLDVTDPFDQGLEVHRDMAAQILPAIKALAQLMDRLEHHE